MSRTLLLDLDGTLVDTVPDLAAAVNRMLRRRGLAELTHPQVAGMVGDGVAALVARAFAAHGAQPDAAAAAEMERDYTANAAIGSVAYPDVAAVLAALRGQGWGLAVCTNKPERAARLLLQALGLLQLMQAVGGGDSFAVRKPDPGHLLATIALAGGRREQTIMLGDLRNDVLAARAAAIPCVFAAWGYGRAEHAEGCAGIAGSMTEAATLINRLLPG